MAKKTTATPPPNSNILGPSGRPSRTPSKSAGLPAGQMNVEKEFTKRTCECGCEKKIPTAKITVVQLVSFENGHVLTHNAAFIKGHEPRPAR